MSARYESIRHDGVIILKGLTAYKPVFDVTTRQTVIVNELHNFSKSRTHLGSFYDKIISMLFVADSVSRRLGTVKSFITSVGHLRQLFAVWSIAY